MSRTPISGELRRRVAEASRLRCANCLTSQRIIGPLLEVDHITPEARGGSSVEENLCLCCPACNGHKAHRESGLDPDTGAIVPFFHPRRERWTDRFEWTEEGTVVHGKTATGRATVLSLQMNHPDMVAVRRLWVMAGWHPPAD